MVPFDSEQAALAAEIACHPGAEELSFADCACLALAVRMNREVITPEPHLSGPELPIRVKVIGYAE